MCCCVGGALISGDDRCSGRLGLVSIMISCGQDTGRQWYAGGEGGGSPGFAIVDGMGRWPRPRCSGTSTAATAIASTA